MPDPTLTVRTPHRSLRRAPAVAALALVVLAGACGSGDGDDERGSPTTDPDAVPLTLPGDGTDDSGSGDSGTGGSGTDDSGGSASDDAPAGWVELEVDGISIDHPEDWTVEEDPRAALVLMIDPAGADFRRNINVIVQSSGGSGTLEDYVALSEQQLEESATEVIESGATTMDDGPAHEWRYTMTSSGVDVEVWTVVAVRDGSAYVVTYTSDPPRFEGELPDVEQAFATVELP